MGAGQRPAPAGQGGTRLMQAARAAWRGIGSSSSSRRPGRWPLQTPCCWGKGGHRGGGEARGEGEGGGKGKASRGRVEGEGVGRAGGGSCR